VDVFNTHLIAQHSVMADDSCDSQPDRLVQAVDMAQAVRCSGSSELCILAGDFNSVAGSLDLRLLMRLTGLSDTLSWGAGSADDTSSAFCTPTFGAPSNTHTPGHVKSDSEPASARSSLCSHQPWCARFLAVACVCR